MLTTRFFVEHQVKSRMFAHYYRDAMDWIVLYKSSLNCGYESISIRAKQFIFLRMSLECILKSILFGLSKRHESAKQTYSCALSCRHNLEKLIAECKIRAKKRYRICSIKTLERIRQIEKLGIGIRYDFDIKKTYRSESFADRYTRTGPVSGIVIDLNCHKVIRHDLILLLKLAQRISNKRFSKHHGYTFNKGQKVENYLQHINKKA